MGDFGGGFSPVSSLLRTPLSGNESPPAGSSLVQGWSPGAWGYGTKPQKLIPGCKNTAYNSYNERFAIHKNTLQYFQSGGGGASAHIAAVIIYRSINHRDLLLHTFFLTYLLNKYRYRYFVNVVSNIDIVSKSKKLYRTSQLLTLIFYAVFLLCRID